MGFAEKSQNKILGEKMKSNKLFKKAISFTLAFALLITNVSFTTFAAETDSEEGDDLADAQKVFTINYYFEGTEEAAHQSDSITVTESAGSVLHTLPVVENASVTDGAVDITLLYTDTELTKNIYYTKNVTLPETATVKFDLAFTNANGKDVVETMKLELPVGEKTTENINSILANADVVAFMESKGLVNNKKKDDSIVKIVVAAEKNGNYNKDNFLGTINLNKKEYDIVLQREDGRLVDTVNLIHGETFKTPTVEEFKADSNVKTLGEKGTTLMWEISDGTTTYQLAPGKKVDVKSNLTIKAVVTHTITYIDGAGDVLSTEEVLHGFTGALTLPTVEPYLYRNHLAWEEGLGLFDTKTGQINSGLAISKPYTFTALYHSLVNANLLPIVVANDYSRQFNNTKVTEEELSIKLVDANDPSIVYEEGVDYTIVYMDTDTNSGMPKIKNVKGENGSQQVIYNVELITDKKKSAFYGVGTIPFNAGNTASYIGKINVEITPIEFTLTIADLSVPVGTALSSTGIDEDIQSQIDAALASTGIKDTAYAKDLGDMTLDYLQTLVGKAGTYEDALGLELIKKGKVTIDGTEYKFNKGNYEVTVSHGDLTVTSVNVPVPAPTPDPTTPPVEETVQAVVQPAPVPAPPVDDEADDEQVEIEDPVAPLAPTVDTEEATTEIEDEQVPTTDAPEAAQNNSYIWIIGLGLAVVLGSIIVFAAKKKSAAK